MYRPVLLSLLSVTLVAGYASLPNDETSTAALAYVSEFVGPAKTTGVVRRAFDNARFKDAAVAPEQGAMKALVQEFLTWIAAETGLAIPPSPSIMFVSEAEMRKRVEGSDGTRVEGSDSARALYVHDTATIYLPGNWNRREIYHRAMLLHELVHHFQLINQVPARCNAEWERQAYGLTLKWLSEQGVEDPYAALNIDDFTVAILSLCFGVSQEH